MRTTTSLLLLSLSVLLPACSSEEATPPGECSDSFFEDSDGDGFGDGNSTMTACEQPTGFVANADDCDDSDDAVNPSGGEVCDGADNDCDGLVDTADPSVDLTTQRAYYRDSDGDGYGDPGSSTSSCDLPSGHVVDNTDCDDGKSAVNPGEIESCDGEDNDCDGLFDDDDDSLDATTAGVYFTDDDRDGYGVGDGVVACARPFGFAEQDGDCDDDASDSHPQASELCNGRDNDCDGGIDGTAGAPNQCTGFAGAYVGSYSHSAVEKLGATIINQMHCLNGTSSLTVDLSRDPPVQGSVSCTYSGGLTAFDTNQSGEIEATVDLDGNVSGTLVHHYDSQLTKTYSFDGTVVGGELEIIDEGSMKPHPMSAVPWEVDYSVVAD